MLSPDREDCLFNLLCRICLSSAQFSSTISTDGYSINTIFTRCREFSSVRVFVFPEKRPIEQTTKVQPVKWEKWWAEKKPSPLCNQSSLLAIHRILHYITVPLAYPSHLLTGAVDHNGSHMLPGAPYYRIITTTKSAKKNENYPDTKWGTKPIKGSAVAGGAPATLAKRTSFPFAWHLWAKTIYRQNSWDNFFFNVISEISTCSPSTAVYWHGLQLTPQGEFMWPSQEQERPIQPGATQFWHDSGFAAFLHYNNLWQSHWWYLTLGGNQVVKQQSKDTASSGASSSLQWEQQWEWHHLASSDIPDSCTVTQRSHISGLRARRCSRRKCSQTRLCEINF